VLTAVDDRLYGGMVAFEVERRDYEPLWKKLGERKIWTLRGQKIRVSSHIHTRRSDLDRLFDTVKEVYG
jgi:selenocysteine lyase/cysteine desulfurase